MLTALPPLIGSSWISFLLLGSILTGSLLGHAWPGVGETLGVAVLGHYGLRLLLGNERFGRLFDRSVDWRGCPTLSMPCLR